VKVAQVNPYGDDLVISGSDAQAFLIQVYEPPGGVFAAEFGKRQMVLFQPSMKALQLSAVSAAGRLAASRP
jgi:hypothetical protein